jgi:hypothetical protein
MQSLPTLEIDEDILLAAQYVADHTGENLGTVISQLARAAIGVNASAGTYVPELGITILPRRPGSKPITMEFIDELRCEVE